MQWVSKWVTLIPSQVASDRHYRLHWEYGGIGPDLRVPGDCDTPHWSDLGKSYIEVAMTLLHTGSLYYHDGMSVFCKFLFFLEKSTEKRVIIEHLTKLVDIQRDWIKMLLGRHCC